MGFTKTIEVEGRGPQLQKGQQISVHCTGYLTNGNKFWSTHDPGQNIFSFSVGTGSVIRGWDEGCLTMRVGEKAKLVVTGDYAYGAQGFPAWGIGPNATLTFVIEVVTAS